MAYIFMSIKTIKMRTETEMYRVMWVNPNGYSEMNADGFSTFDEAEKYFEELSDDFIDETYYVEPYTHVERTYANPNAVDGWEDIYQLDE